MYEFKLFDRITTPNLHSKTLISLPNILGDITPNHQNLMKHVEEEEEEGDWWMMTHVE
jgi:hypothetical protein